MLLVAVAPVVLFAAGAERSVLAEPLWLGMARPAWDTKGQTWADKIHKTIAIEVEQPAQIPK
ncbi:hypothetical protein [Kitasatospora sp. NPDC056531]|uniref:hypothetical protein n=1 Tax=Kitasatospora sp. NPDC056531 TaxID=3345856 RepID=UPI0036963B9B